MGVFVAVDVEAANRNSASICQIGLAAFNDNARVWEWSSLVNPEEPFEHGNVGIHGITAADVAAAPAFPEVLAGIRGSLEGQVIASHWRFDCDALHQAAEKYALKFPYCRWIDTCEIARLAWPDFANHKLKTLCCNLGLELTHHDAGSDAIACGEILARARTVTGLKLHELIARVGTLKPARYRPQDVPQSPARARIPEKIEMQGRPGGPLSGHVAVCTGEFSIGKRALVEIAAALGCDVEETFSARRTTLVITGRRNPADFGGKMKSEKLLKAEAAVAAGRKIIILSEQEFLALSQRILARAVT